MIMVLRNVSNVSFVSCHGQTNARLCGVMQNGCFTNSNQIDLQSLDLSLNISELWSHPNKQANSKRFNNDDTASRVCVAGLFIMCPLYNLLYYIINDIMVIKWMYDYDTMMVSWWYCDNIVMILWWHRDDIVMILWW